MTLGRSLETDAGLKHSQGWSNYKEPVPPSSQQPEQMHKGPSVSACSPQGRSQHLHPGKRKMEERKEHFYIIFFLV